MRDFTYYTEKAISRYGLAGQNALAAEIGINKSAMSQLATGRTLPSEATMIKLAELAGLPKEEALIDLNLWRSKNNPEVNKIWTRLSKMIRYLLIISLCISLYVNSCFANTIINSCCTQKSTQIIYYATKVFTSGGDCFAKVYISFSCFFNRFFCYELVLLFLLEVMFMRCFFF